MKHTNHNHSNGHTANADLSVFTYGKLPPQSLELEEAILGAIMLDKTAMTIAAEILKPSDFYMEANAEVFTAALALHEQMRPIDLLTVIEQLKKQDALIRVGGPAYLAELTHRVASSANLEYHCRIVMEKSMRRALIAESVNNTRAAYDDGQDVFDVVEQAETGIFRVTGRIVTGQSYTMQQVAASYIERLEKLRKMTGGLVGYTWGLSEVDAFTGGLQSPDLIILAARPGMGKTAFMLTVAKKTAEAGNPVIVFSMEMSREQLFNRMVCMETGLSTTAAARPNKLSQQDFDKLRKGTEICSELPIKIDDTPAISISELRSKARQAVRNGAKVIFVDYLQLMRGREGGNREQEVSSISAGLKAIAKELNVPVVALSQLSRAVETRGGDKRPMLSDLRESGAVEQDADIVTFLYRPEYYNIEKNEQGESQTGLAELIFAKHRNGALDKVLLRFIAHETRFANFVEHVSNTFPTSTAPAPDHNNGAMVAARAGGDDQDVPF